MIYRPPLVQAPSGFWFRPDAVDAVDTDHVAGSDSSSWRVVILLSGSEAAYSSDLSSLEVAKELRDAVAAWLSVGAVSTAPEARP